LCNPESPDPYLMAGGLRIPACGFFSMTAMAKMLPRLIIGSYSTFIISASCARMMVEASRHESIITRDPAGRFSDQPETASP